MRSWLRLLVASSIIAASFAPTSARALDQDADGTPDTSDNCLVDENGPAVPGQYVQRDTNLDG